MKISENYNLYKEKEGTGTYLPLESSGTFIFSDLNGNKYAMASNERCSWEVEIPDEKIIYRGFEFKDLYVHDTIAGQCVIAAVRPSTKKFRKIEQRIKEAITPYKIVFAQRNSANWAFKNGILDSIIVKYRKTFQ